MRERIIQKFSIERNAPVAMVVQEEKSLSVRMNEEHFLEEVRFIGSLLT